MATPPATAPALLWFRRDLRLADNPALHAAVRSGRPLVCVYVRDRESGHRYSPGSASDWWLHHSLTSLSADLRKRGGQPIALIEGDPEVAIPELAQKLGAAEVFWNQTGWPCQNARDSRIADTLKDDGIKPRGFRGVTLVHPPELLNGSGKPYKVFSAFWRAALKELAPKDALPAPDSLPDGPDCDGATLEDWGLLPSKPNWAKGFAERWTPGEAAARKQLDAFLKDDLADYPTHRDRPDLDETSRLSPHLAWGEISPRAVWHRVKLQAEGSGQFKAADKYLAEIGWRDFAYYLAWHFEDLRTINFNRDFDHFPWRDHAEGLQAWKEGRTGVPMVDAAMRQLWVTGWMHNRTRMIAASYLIKHIGCDWREGMRWFEDTLVDADPMVNAASWQWVAGSGADAAPYFRIFNPASQGEKFDPDGKYVRQWVEELRDVPTRHIHAPWEASEGELVRAGVTLGKTYPKPVVDLKTGRERALEAYQEMKEAAA